MGGGDLGSATNHASRKEDDGVDKPMVSGAKNRDMEDRVSAEKDSPVDKVGDSDDELSGRKMKEKMHLFGPIVLWPKSMHWCSIAIPESGSAAGILCLYAGAAGLCLICINCMRGEYAADLGCCFMGFPESGSADVGLCLICINSKLCCMLLFGLQYAVAQRPSGRRLLRNATVVWAGLV
ncbi:hypothetical protein LOK49_LG10G00502 [Camellia lanceoleosa]|uniref:Uncharacterized protein n=1 Tax=Camellia lanceoleosa TaxID=1840588 RepID=A0ACC0GA69_9ERIC|nr:hypothetical protein LOK49_LG10G00502 [Camellia lanceoleosa]